jgi:hypothetical protein
MAKNKTKTWINFRIYFGGSVFLRLPVTFVFTLIYAIPQAPTIFLNA